MEAVSATSLVTRPVLEPKVRVVTLAIGLPAITIEGVSLVTRPPILVNKMMSLPDL